jgi:hypothetical protein
MGALASVGAPSADGDSQWLSLSAQDILNDALMTNLAKTLPSAVAAEEGSDKRGGVDSAHQVLRALSDLLGSTSETAAASVKASNVVGASRVAPPACAHPKCVWFGRVACGPRTGGCAAWGRCVGGRECDPTWKPIQR